MTLSSWKRSTISRAKREIFLHRRHRMKSERDSLLRSAMSRATLYVLLAFYTHIHVYTHTSTHVCMHIRSFRPFLLLRGAPDYSTDTVSEFHAEAQRQLQVKD